MNIRYEDEGWRQRRKTKKRKERKDSNIHIDNGGSRSLSSGPNRVLGHVVVGSDRNSRDRHCLGRHGKVGRKGDGLRDDNITLDWSSNSGSAVVDPGGGKSRLDVQRCTECAAIGLLLDVIDQLLTRRAGGWRRLDEIRRRCNRNSREEEKDRLVHVGHWQDDRGGG